MTGQNLTPDPDKQERFCSWCGLNLFPLSANPYVSKNCTECGKAVYTFPSSAETGNGFVIRDGETLHNFFFNPFSLNPERGNRGSLTKFGLLTTVKLILLAELKSEVELEELLNLYRNKAEAFLRKNVILDELDWDNDAHSEEIFRRLIKDKDKREFFAFRMFLSSQDCKQALKDNNARQAAWHMYHAAMSHCFFEIGEPNFEETLWQGHQAHIFLTKVQNISEQTPTQAQAIEKLKPLFERQAEITLHTWIEDKLSIGECLGLTELPEETLKAIAKYYLAQFEQRRQEVQQEKEDKRKEEDFKIQQRLGWNPIIIACITSLAAIIIALINKYIPSIH